MGGSSRRWPRCSAAVWVLLCFRSRHAGDYSQHCPPARSPVSLHRLFGQRRRFVPGARARVPTRLLLRRAIRDLPDYAYVHACFLRPTCYLHALRATRAITPAPLFGRVRAARQVALTAAELAAMPDQAYEVDQMDQQRVAVPPGSSACAEAQLAEKLLRSFHTMHPSLWIAPPEGYSHLDLAAVDAPPPPLSPPSQRCHAHFA